MNMICTERSKHRGCGGPAGNLRRLLLRFLSDIRAAVEPAADALRHPMRIAAYRAQLRDQINVFSLRLLPWAAVTALAVGLLAMWRFGRQAAPGMAAGFAAGRIFQDTVVRLSPVMLALALAVACGASFSRSYRSMPSGIRRDIESDASGSFFLPRMLAGLTMLPLMTVLVEAAAALGLFLAAGSGGGGIDFQEFMRGLRIDPGSLELYRTLLLRPALFGLLIAVVVSAVGFRILERGESGWPAWVRSLVISGIGVGTVELILSRGLL